MLGFKRAIDDVGINREIGVLLRQFRPIRFGECLSHPPRRNDNEGILSLYHKGRKERAAPGCNT